MKKIESDIRGSKAVFALPAVYEAFQRCLDRAKLPETEVDSALVLSTYVDSEYRDREDSVGVIAKPELEAIEKLGQALVATLTHHAYRHNMLDRVRAGLPSLVDDAAQRATVAAILDRLDPH